MKFNLTKIRLPLARNIGDHSCAYNEIDLILLELRDSEGNVGYGWGGGVSKGYFAKTGWWLQPMKAEKQLSWIFEKEVQGVWAGLDIEKDFDQILAISISSKPLLMAFHQAMWDLRAKRANQSVYQILGGRNSETCVLGYGSILDYPLSDEEAVERAKFFLTLGFKFIKVKIGGRDFQRDLNRLKLIQSTVGSDVRLMADANSGWNLSEATQFLNLLKSEGIELQFIEDPIEGSRLDDYLQLKHLSAFPVAAYDDFDELDSYLPYISKNAMHLLIPGQTLTNQRVIVPKAFEKGIRMLYGNSMMELNIHAAAAYPATTWIEFSDIAWNQLIQNPVKIKNGSLELPQGLGYGLEPKMDFIQELRSPEESVLELLPCPWEKK